MCSTPKKSSRLILLLAALASTSAHASQLVSNADKQAVNVNISVAEANRLTVQGRRILSIVPSQVGVIDYVKDEDAGAFFFGPRKDVAGKPPETGAGNVTLFVTDDQAVNYRIVAVPRPGLAAEDIVIEPPQPKAGGSSIAPSGGARSDGRAASYQRRIKDLILMMADETSYGVQVDKQEVNKEVPLWQEARLVFLAKYLESEVVGEKYRLTNVSPKDMLIVEQELYRKGVRAVSVRSMTLSPGDSTEVYIVRERAENE